MSGRARLRPILHFVVLGTLLFGARQLWPDREPIAVAADQVDEEILVREALRVGLDRTDPVVRTRLTQNLRFARGGGDDAALFEEALALGMAMRDVVARRRLAQAMEERLVAGVRIDDAEVDAYIAAHPQRYAGARRVSFEQVFAPRDAASATLLPGRHVEARSEAELARMFGDRFARDVVAAPVGQWHGPLQSAFGTHQVRVTAITQDPVELAGLRRQAYYALLEQAETAAVQDALASLRRAYRIEVEPQKVALQ